MVVADVNRPVPGPDEALIAVRAAGICGSDIHGYTGASGRRTPGMVMGHEFAGEVVALGPGVGGGGGHTCGREPAALLWRMPRLPRRARTTLSAAHEHRGQPGQRGGFAEWVTVRARNAIPLADSVSFAAGTLAEPLAVGVRATAVARPQAGQPLLVLGGGTIGLCTLLACRACGADPVLVTDVAPHKRAIDRPAGRAPA